MSTILLLTWLSLSIVDYWPGCQQNVKKSIVVAPGKELVSIIILLPAATFQGDSHLSTCRSSSLCSYSILPVSSRKRRKRLKLVFAVLTLVVCKYVSTLRNTRCSPKPLLATETSPRGGNKRKWRRTWVFCCTNGKPLHVSNLISRSFRSLLEKASIPPIRFHDLRPTTATLLLSMGTHPKFVQELLGHSQIIVTLEIYSHILPPLQEEVMLQFHAMLTAPGLS
ncbi:tyrosine-type recombinase/integrase [Dictyobacter kobayashii]|uniref:tyrosine-type recombinase/integrase n=1 Tax=Dictyobacter kobayashii TaxID=2014872 RepID=UPI000F841CFE|nr:tyrosine-type recombinase/integrase [Dictyobacter kobayashii]